jgi:DNA-binding MarR family transcriptional regulator
MNERRVNKMSTRDQDFMDIVSETVNHAMKVQEDFLKQGPFPELSLTEVHVIEAVSKETFPTMSNVAKRLQVTVGTLTTNVKSIVKKGFLTKETYTKDRRFTILSITPKGYEALAYHDEFHKKLTDLCDVYIPAERFKWVTETFGKINDALEDYRENVKAEK